MVVFVNCDRKNNFKNYLNSLDEISLPLVYNATNGIKGNDTSNTYNSYLFKKFKQDWSAKPLGILYQNQNFTLIPELLIVNYNVPFYFGGTSLLIIVVVIMDLMGQVQSHLMSQQYESLMKKTNLTGKSGGSGRRRRR